MRQKNPLLNCRDPGTNHGPKLYHRTHTLRSVAVTPSNQIIGPQAENIALALEDRGARLSEISEQKAG